MFVQGQRGLLGVTQIVKWQIKNPNTARLLSSNSLYNIALHVLIWAREQSRSSAPEASAPSLQAPLKWVRWARERGGAQSTNFHMALET